MSYFLLFKGLEFYLHKMKRKKIVKVKNGIWCIDKINTKYYYFCAIVSNKQTDITVPQASSHTSVWRDGPPPPPYFNLSA